MYYQSTDQKFCLYKGDSLLILGQISNQFDMIFADPPYFLSNGGKKIQGRRLVSVDKGEWDKAKSSDDIDKFNQEWINILFSYLNKKSKSHMLYRVHKIKECLEYNQIFYAKSYFF